MDMVITGAVIMEVVIMVAAITEAGIIVVMLQVRFWLVDYSDMRLPSIVTDNREPFIGQFM